MRSHAPKNMSWTVPVLRNVGDWKTKETHIWYMICSITVTAANDWFSKNIHVSFFRTIVPYFTHEDSVRWWMIPNWTMAPSIIHPTLLTTVWLNINRRIGHSFHPRHESINPPESMRNQQPCHHLSLLKRKRPKVRKFKLCSIQR